MPIDPLATNQVEVVRGPAALRYGSTSIGGVVSATNNRIPEALPSCPAAPFQSYGLPVKAPLADAQSAVMRHCRDPHGRQFGRSRRRRRHPARCRRRQFRRSMPTPMAARPATTAFPAIPICSTRRGRSTEGSRTRRRKPTALRSAAPTSSTAASSAPRSRRTTRSIASPASTAPITRPASTRIRPSFRPRANTGRTRRRSMPSGSGPAPPTTSTTRSASPIPPTSRHWACGRPSPTRSRKAASRCRWRRSMRALPPSPPRSACRPATRN